MTNIRPLSLLSKVISFGLSITQVTEALKQCDHQALHMFLAEKQCEFVFNAPSASHAGGVWERQIRTIRNVLNATLTQSLGRLMMPPSKHSFMKPWPLLTAVP